GILTLTRQDVNFPTLSLQRTERQGWGTLGLFFDYSWVDLHPLGWARDVAFVWTDPVADNSSAEDVGHELISFSVPHEQSRTRTAATIYFRELGLLVRSDFDFVLEHTGRPEQTHDIGLLGLAEADGQIR